MLVRGVSTRRKPADIYVSVLAAGFESLRVEPVWREKEAIALGNASGKNVSQYPLPYINLNYVYRMLHLKPACLHGEIKKAGLV
jgi:hypothetical protein